MDLSDLAYGTRPNHYGGVPKEYSETKPLDLFRQINELFEHFVAFNEDDDILATPKAAAVIVLKPHSKRKGA